MLNHSLLHRAPAWVLRPTGIIPAVDLDFQNRRYWQDHAFGRTATDLITTARASVAYAADLAGNYTLFPSNTARITNAGLWVEEARTNLLLQSSALTNAAWSPANETATGAQADPAAGTSAVLLVPTSTNAVHTQVNTTSLTLTAAIYTWSVFVKPAGYNFAQLIGNSGASNFRNCVTFNLTTGAVTQTNLINAPTNTSASATVYPNGWVRLQLQMTATADATTSGIQFQPVPTGTPTVNGNGVATYAGDAASGALFWDPQLELGTFATAPTATTTAAATRAADVVTLTNVPVFGSAYTLFGKGTPMAPAASVNNQGIVELTDGSENNRLLAFRNSTTGLLGYRYTIGAAQVYSTAGAGWAQSASGKVAIAGQANDQQGVFGGTLAAAGSGAGSFVPSQLNIGSFSNSTTFWNGPIERIALWPSTRLPNAALQQVTT